MVVTCVTLLTFVSFVPHLGAAGQTDYVCNDDAKKLFTVKGFPATLYKNDVEICHWESKGVRGTCDGKVRLDDMSDITLNKISIEDEGSFILKFYNETTGKYEEETTAVHVAVPPSPGCKPIIMEQQDKHHPKIRHVNATLPGSGCGTPLVETYWYKSDPNNYLLDVNCTQRNTHLACIRGPAMDCERNQPDIEYCSEYYINNSECFKEKISWIIGMGVALGVALLVVIILICVLFCKRKCTNVAQGDVEPNDQELETLN